MTTPHPTSHPERRQHARRPLAELVGRVGFSQPMRVLDLSLQGARVRTGEALAPRRRYHFQLAGLDLVGEVARCALVLLEPDEEGGRPRFESGVAFETLSPAVQRRLRRLLASLPRHGPGPVAVATG